MERGTYGILHFNGTHPNILFKMTTKANIDLWNKIVSNEKPIYVLLVNSKTGMFMHLGFQKATPELGWTTYVYRRDTPDGAWIKALMDDRELIGRFDFDTRKKTIFNETMIEPIEHFFCTRNKE